MIVHGICPKKDLSQNANNSTIDFIYLIILNTLQDPADKHNKWKKFI